MPSWGWEYFIWFYSWFVYVLFVSRFRMSCLGLGILFLYIYACIHTKICTCLLSCMQLSQHVSFVLCATPFDLPLWLLLSLSFSVAFFRFASLSLAPFHSLPVFLTDRKNYIYVSLSFCFSLLLDLFLSTLVAWVRRSCTRVWITSLLIWKRREFCLECAIQAHLCLSQTLILLPKSQDIKQVGWKPASTNLSPLCFWICFDMFSTQCLAHATSGLCLFLSHVCPASLSRVRARSLSLACALPISLSLSLSVFISPSLWLALDLLPGFTFCFSLWPHAHTHTHSHHRAVQFSIAIWGGFD